MTQSQFMYELMKELDFMSDEKKYDIMNDYNGFFSEQTDNGKSEDEIIDLLRSPKEIAESYRSGMPLSLEFLTSDSSEHIPAYKRIIKFILLIPCAVVYVPVTAVLGAVLIALSVILCAVGVAVSVYSFSALHLSLGFAVIGIGGIVFTFAFVMLCVAFVQLTSKMVTYFPRYMGRLLGNTDRSVK